MLSVFCRHLGRSISGILPQIMKRTRDSARNGWFWLAGLTAFGWLVYLLTPMLSPFVAGAVLAYIVAPLVDWLEHRRVGRTLGTLLVIVLLMLALACLLVLIVPMLINQGQALSLRLPGLVDWAENTLSPWLRDTWGMTWHFDAATLKRELTSNLGALRGMLARAAPLITDQGLALFGYLSNLLLLPLVLFYLVRDWQQFTRPLARLIPRRWYRDLGMLGDEIDDMLGQFLRGQIKQHQRQQQQIGQITKQGQALVGDQGRGARQHAAQRAQIAGQLALERGGVKMPGHAPGVAQPGRQGVFCPVHQARQAQRQGLALVDQHWHDQHQ
jgi:hypothetical protein